MGQGQRLERELAVVDHIIVAQAAYDAVVREWPTKWITLRQAARVIDQLLLRPEPAHSKFNGA